MDYFLKDFLHHKWFIIYLKKFSIHFNIVTESHCKFYNSLNLLSISEIHMHTHTNTLLPIYIYANKLQILTTKIHEKSNEKDRNGMLWLQCEIKPVLLCHKGWYMVGAPLSALAAASLAAASSLFVALAWNCNLENIGQEYK